MSDPTKVSDFMQESDFADLLNKASRATLSEREIQTMSILTEKFRIHRSRAFVTKHQIDLLTSLANRGVGGRSRPVTWESTVGKSERPMYAPPRQTELEEAGEKFIQATAQFVYALMRAVL